VRKKKITNSDCKKAPMDKSYITSVLKKGSSNLRTSDILGSLTFLRKNNIEVESLLGCGSLGATMLAHKISNALEPEPSIAVKLVYVESEEDLAVYIEQLSKISMLKSPNTANMIGVLSNIDNNCLFILSEYFPNGNLITYFKANRDLNET